MALSATGLFKFGNFEFPSTSIAEGGYVIKPNQRQDLDPFTDQTGLTHRNALSHTKTEIAITTRENLTWQEMHTILDGLQTNYTSWAERDAQCEYFDPETESIQSGHMYLESSQGYTVKLYKKLKANDPDTNRKMYYPSTTFTFVEY